ncbi:sodium/proline symporter PutP [Ureibacillus aquaedulcis]|uniref:Sodium/proline symporter n=1 Tax=Ureibacillus aquaedulcis TaxID=3058421 RepID=A0ABT8GN18_9BACL|nr:sodium/proline symporter PutP [Ureibacillus sp. BA0131]MDN4492807.1 sodium/proline symporter PutP [Ureibacillus sp. BA0131]
MSSITITVFILYFAILFVIGYLAYRRTSNVEDYILGGRQLGPFIGGISTGASDMSGWLLLGLPGAVYLSGLSEIWIGVGLAIGAYINWQYVGKRIRVYTQVANNSLTLPDFLENRFRDHSKSLRIVASVFILIFFAFYISSGLVGGAVLFETTFGISYKTALIVGSAVIIGYTMIGGFFAVAWTDFFQGLLMFLALITIPIVALFNLGNWKDAINTIGSISVEHLDVFAGTTALGIISLLAWGLGYFGQPHVIVRFMAMTTSKDITIGRSVYTIWNVAAILGAIFTGFFGIAYFVGDPLANPETVFIVFAQTLFNPWVTGLLLVAVLSAIMSTISSQLIIAASALSEDLYKGLFRKNASQRELMWVARLAVLAISIFATILALNPESSVLSLVGYAWAGFGAVFGPAILLSLFWKKTTKNGVLAGMIVGGVTVIVWSELTKAGIIPFYLYEIIPGFFGSLLAVIVVSLMKDTVSKEMVEEFEAVNLSEI